MYLLIDKAPKEDMHYLKFKKIFQGEKHSHSVKLHIGGIWECEDEQK